MTMNVTINGEAKHLNGAMTLNEMLAFLGLDPKKIAVERNLEIVPRSTYASVQVKDGDKYEIVHFIGGGNAPVDKPFVVAGKTFKSRLIIGTGKYKSYEENARALEASGAEIVTVAVRRVNLTDPNQPKLIDFIDPKKYTYLPNTAGCFTGEDAVRTLRLAREAGGWTLVKLEVLGEKKLLYPDMLETLRATEMLTKDGFQVMVYCSDDPILAKRLEDMGAAAIMPLASPIGSGHGRPEHGQHPHDHRGCEGARHRRCRHRHGVRRGGRDGTGLRCGDFQHRHRACQGSGEDGRRDETRRGGGQACLSRRPHAEEALCRSVESDDRSDLNFDQAIKVMARCCGP